ncbi:short-chain dehydrogenase [Exophiala viscosa]|uniref:short-chain dehydrogenase n=1 Tax=Exophiala viscosa TaxID=2486360 RepID=UPI002197B6AD|nr:short-chain dehydrogenase [Exophiala viscosa]
MSDEKENPWGLKTDSNRTSNPGFNRETTATEVASTFSNVVRGKTVIVVGVSPKSLGESITLAFAANSPQLLVLASRTMSKIKAVATKVKEQYPNVQLQLVEVDLSSFASIREAATEINNFVDEIDILVNNAGVVVTDPRTTKDGLELQFGTNHIGIFLLTNLLMPKILKAAQKSQSKGSTRIINMTSAGHLISPIRFSDYNFKKRPEEIPEDERPTSRPGASFDPPPGKTYVPFVAYGQSKTGNILMALSISQKLASEGVRSIATHPGSIWTDMSRNLDEEHRNIIEKTGDFWKNQDQGGATTLVAALDPKLAEDKDIIYLADCQVAGCAPWASDPKAAARLWGLSEEIVGQKFDLGQASNL